MTIRLALSATLLALLFALATLGHAQSAKVIQLSPNDAELARQLYAERDLINKRIDELQKMVEERYLSDIKPGPSSTFIAGSGITVGCGMILSLNGQPSCPPESAADKKSREEREAAQKAEDAKLTHLERKPGWKQFEFSEDFKYVVPAQLVPQSASSAYHLCNGIFGAANLTTAPLVAW